MLEFNKNLYDSLIQKLQDKISKQLDSMRYSLMGRARGELQTDERRLHILNNLDTYDPSRSFLRDEVRNVFAQPANSGVNDKPKRVTFGAVVRLSIENLWARLYTLEGIAELTYADDKTLLAVDVETFNLTSGAHG